MKLSDAIAVGRTIEQEHMASTYCGCALAMGLQAAGKSDGLRRELLGGLAISEQWREAEIKEWPWLKESFSVPDIPRRPFAYVDNYEKDQAFKIISEFYYAVEQEERTLDQLIDWVRSVEPAEPDSHIAEAEEFRAKHDLHPAIPAEEISEVMVLAELGLLPKICPACATKHGEQQCWGQGCQCKCQLEAA